METTLQQTRPTYLLKFLSLWFSMLRALDITLNHFFYLLLVVNGLRKHRLFSCPHLTRFSSNELTEGASTLYEGSRFQFTFINLLLITFTSYTV